MKMKISLVGKAVWVVSPQQQEKHITNNTTLDNGQQSAQGFK